MTLPAQEFTRRPLQRVPLKGLYRVRAFRLLHSSHRTKLRRLQLLLNEHERVTLADKRVRAEPQCPAGEPALGLAEHEPRSSPNSGAF